MSEIEVVAREVGDRRVEIAGHTAQAVAVATVHGERARYECVDCGLRSNRVTLFDQQECEGGDSA